MENISVQFVRGRGWSSQLIGWTDMFSHVDLVLETGELLGARSDKLAGRPRGVQIRPPDYEKWSVQMRVEIPCTKEQRAQFYNIALNQLGRPYDSWDILGFVFGRNWREPDSWICSELFMWCLEKTEVADHLWLPTSRITPGMAAMCATTIPGSKYWFPRTPTHWLALKLLEQQRDPLQPLPAPLLPRRTP